MKSISEVYVISGIVNMMREGNVNLDHFLQRESFQWSMRQRVKLIDTLMRGYPFPAIYAIKESDDSNAMAVLDGKQRLLTIKSFIIDDGFAFRQHAPIIINGEEQDVDGKRFSELPDVVRNRILNANFSVITFTGYSVSDVYEIFDRLNNGTPLTKAEKCKPLMGDRMIGRMRRIMDSGFFEKTGFTARQLGKGNGYTVLIQCLMLIATGGSTGFSAPQVSRFLDENAELLTDSDYDQLDRLIAWVSDVADGVSIEHCRASLDRMSIAPIVYALSTVEDDAQARERMRNNLLIFLSRDSQPEEYRALCQKSTDRTRVEGRVEYFLRMTR